MMHSGKNSPKIFKYVLKVYFLTILAAPLLYFSTSTALINPSRLISYDVLVLWIFSVFYGLFVCPPVLLVAYVIVKVIDKSLMILRFKKTVLCLFSLIMVLPFYYMLPGADDKETGINFPVLMCVYMLSAITSIIFSQLPSQTAEA